MKISATHGCWSSRCTFGHQDDLRNDGRRPGVRVYTCCLMIWLSNVFGRGTVKLFDEENGRYYHVSRDSLDKWLRRRGVPDAKGFSAEEYERNIQAVVAAKSPNVKVRAPVTPAVPEQGEQPERSPQDDKAPTQAAPSVEAAEPLSIDVPPEEPEEPIATFSPTQSRRSSLSLESDSSLSPTSSRRSSLSLDGDGALSPTPAPLLEPLPGNLTPFPSDLVLSPARTPVLVPRLLLPSDSQSELMMLESPAMSPAKSPRLITTRINTNATHYLNQIIRHHKDTAHPPKIPLSHEAREQVKKEIGFDYSLDKVHGKEQGSSLLKKLTKKKDPNFEVIIFLGMCQYPNLELACEYFLFAARITGDQLVLTKIREIKVLELRSYTLGRYFQTQAEKSKDENSDNHYVRAIGHYCNAHRFNCKRKIPHVLDLYKKINKKNGQARLSAIRFIGKFYTTSSPSYTDLSNYCKEANRLGDPLVLYTLGMIYKGKYLGPPDLREALSCFTTLVTHKIVNQKVAKGEDHKEYFRSIIQILKLKPLFGLGLLYKHSLIGQNALTNAEVVQFLQSMKFDHQHHAFFKIPEVRQRLEESSASSPAGATNRPMSETGAAPHTAQDLRAMALDGVKHKQYSNAGKYFVDLHQVEPITNPEKNIDDFECIDVVIKQLTGKIQNVNLVTSLAKILRHSPNPEHVSAAEAILKTHAH